MKNFFLNFVKNIFSLQERFLEGKIGKKMNVLNYSKNPMVKNRLTSSATLTFSSELDKQKQQIDEAVLKLAKESKGDFIELLNYAKKEGDNFYFIKNAKKLLKFINEEEGLIMPKFGKNALFLNLLTKKAFSFKSPVIFVFEEGEFNPYTILYSFYKWFAYKKNLPGLDLETINKFKNIDELRNPDAFDNMSYEDIMSAKQIIAREREAMEFALAFMKELEGSKNAYSVIKKDKSAEI